MTPIARWESKGGRYVAELYKADGSGFYYNSNNGSGGYLGNDVSEAQAIAMMEQRCAAGTGYFQPDANKSPLRRVL